jgi:hypothetical protein
VQRYRQGHRECHKRHLAVDFRSFLNTINKSVPADLDVHVIMDNYATHSAPRSSAGLLVTLASISCATRRSCAGERR